MTMRKRLPLLLICLLLTALFSACSKPVDLKLRLQPGDKRVIEITNDLTTTVTAMGNTQTQPQKGVQRYTYEVQEVDATGVAKVKVTTDMGGMMEQFGGGMGGDMGPMGDSFGQIGEITLSMKLAPDGTVQSVEGMDVVADKVVTVLKDTMQKQMGSLPPEALANMGDMNSMFDGVKKMMGDEAMKKQMQGMTGFYPDQPVSLGSTWTRTIPVGGPMPMNVDMTYTVAARGGGVMNVKFEGDIKTAPGGGMDLGFMKMDFQMSGTQSGTMQVDEATGWVTASSIQQSMEGSMKVMDMSMPMKTEGKIYIKSFVE